MAVTMALAGPAALVHAQQPVSAPAVRTTEGPNVIIKSEHRRLPFPRDIQRIAVGDTDIELSDQRLRVRFLVHEARSRE